MTYRKIFLYIASSLDGYVATKEDDISFLSSVETAGEDYGYSTFSQSIDTYIVGKKTYDVVMKLTGGSFPPAEAFQCYVITHQPLPASGNVTFYSGDLKLLIENLRKTSGKHIYCDGGPQIIRQLLQENLIDEFIISTIPILLGGGKPLFAEGIPYIQLEHLHTTSFKTGLVQSHYRRLEK